MADTLAVYLAGERIGSLTKGDGTDYTFAYDEDIVARTETGTTVLSQSLPLRPEPFGSTQARPYFEGLLPEDQRRTAIATRNRISENDGFRLLELLGRDCAGAVVILPEEEELPSEPGTVDWLMDAELGELVESLPTNPSGQTKSGKRIRMSLAGAQRKLTLIRSGSGQFGEPQADAPSTHLIKPQYEDVEFPDIVTNEVFCLKVAGCVGIVVPHTEILEVGKRLCLLSQRFDRSSDGTKVIRLHQEDLCQATGTSPNLKYEGNGGPSFATFGELLREIGRAADLSAVIEAAVFNFIIGNSDAHGKNFAILFGELGRRLAPLYDLVCTDIYEVSSEMGMAIGTQFDPSEVHIGDWMDLSHDLDVPLEGFTERVQGIADQTLACAGVIADLAKAEGWHTPVIDKILRVCEARHAQLDLA